MGEPQSVGGGSEVLADSALPPLSSDPGVLPLPGGEPPPSDPAAAPPPPEERSSPSPPVKESPPPPSPSSSPPPSTPAASSPPPSSPPPSTPAASSPPPTPPAPSEPSISKPSPSSSSSSSPPPPAAESTPSQPPPSSNSNTPPAPIENPAMPAVFSPPEAQIPQTPSGRPFTGPPPINHKTPPEASHGSHYSPPSSDDSTNSSVLVIGVVLAGALLLVIIGICIACSKKKKKPQYYMDHGLKANDPYYNGPNHWNNSPMDHVVKVPPRGVQMGTPGGGGGGWGAPPLQPGNASGEFHSGLFNSHLPVSPNMGMGGFNQSTFSYQDLAAATGGFSQTNLLGQGGFGYVHKGVLPDGRVVAVKSLKTGSGQGEREFQAEVDIISRVHHRHLVSLVGYCIADGQRMLVYEFVPNSTLEFHLHGKGQPVMSWEVRLRIARGSAKGLAYLHEDCHPRIIHRDIKAANILLDDNFEAMVADFGLAKLSSGNDTHVSTRVMGTFGYLAPEYASSGKLSDKSDVFSFGVMLLELITGRRPVDPNDRYMEDSLVDWARPLMGKALEDGDYKEIADPRLEGNFVAQEMARLVACAAASIRHSARRRPKMSQIARALEGDSSLEDLNDGGNKTQIPSASGSATSESSVYDTKMYNADMSKFRKMVMTTGEFNSSDFGGTSEFGLNPSSTSSESSNSAETLKGKK